jgi:protein-S-isoprenylcysteine O-methyltransferase Ste14
MSLRTKQSLHYVDVNIRCAILEPTLNGKARFTKPAWGATCRELGLARPPAIYLIAIATGLLLHFAWPIPFVPSWAKPLGALIAVFAATLFMWSVKTFHSAETPVPGNRPTTEIVRVGPYRFSRNPIYLAFSLFQTGIALMVNDAWIMLTLLPAISLMSFVVIPREERYLEARFGEEYKTYKASVRRWL